MNRITLCLAYYRNPGMLRRQLGALRQLDPRLAAQLELIVVDDGSPAEQAALPIFLEVGEIRIPRQLFRMGVDIAWNMDACRNLAVSKASTPWVLLTDIDHMVPEATWRKILNLGLNPGAAYKFARVSEPKLDPYKPHPNTWLMSRDLYDRAGGYDERFAGWYGTDGDFRNRVAKLGPVVNLKEVIVRVPREVTPDASTTTLTRRSDENLAALDRIKAERNTIKGWKPLRGRFPWDQVL